MMERYLAVMARRLNRGMVIILIVSAGFVRVDTAAAAIDAEAVRDEILAGVAALGDPGGPGKMVVFGESACSVANYQGQDHRDPMIAAANWGLGRVIALPDHQWLEMDSLGAEADTGRFYLNSLAWLAGTTSKTIRIVVTPNTSAVNWLSTQGFTNVVQSSSYSTQLQTADVLVGWLGSNVSQSTIDTIADFVRNGGGLFLCDYGIGYEWWWSGSADVPHAPGNRLLREPGIGFSSDWPGGGLTLTRATGQMTAADVLDMLADSTGFTQTELDIGAKILDRLFQVLPEGDPLLAQLDAAFYTRIDTISPTPASPVEDAFEKALLQREADILQNTPADEVTAHRTAEAVYGVIPAGAPRVSRTVTLDTSRGRWHSTGLYAVPGELVTLVVPGSLSGQGYKVRINAHKDNIGSRSSWERPPYVHRSFSINSTTVEVANAFGGSIFIEFGGGAYDAPPDLGQVQITISGAIEQPHFVLGQHSDEQWISQLRDNPAPYAVLASENLILSFRSAEAMELTEPEALMTWWNEVVALQDDLASRLEVRTGAELINIDVQNSAGAAHSGFPIQAYDKHWGNPADYDRLIVQGSWGNFHELGHNQQRGWWKFSGDGEVTVNVFSTYALRTLASNPTGGWSWTVHPDEVMDRATSAVVKAATYSGLSSLGDRLAFWIQLVDGFGWDAYKQVLGDYEWDDKYNSGSMPSSDQEEKDQWLVRFSGAVGYNLSRFMRDTWGLQVSQSAVDAVSHLPDWMPLATRIGKTTVLPQTEYVFDIAGDAMSMDGAATVADVSESTNGTLVDNGNGTWSYTSKRGYIGADAFTFTLQSGAGNTQTFPVDINVSNRGALMETWYGISGSQVSDLTSDGRYPDNPDEMMITESMEAPVDRADSYGVRMRAVLVAPKTEFYLFWIASDDYGELYLSTDSSPANKSKVAYVNGWTDWRQWDKFTSQKSAARRLDEGKRYYIEALMKEGAGKDNLSIAWQGQSFSQQVIGNEYLRVYGHDNVPPVFSEGAIVKSEAVESVAYNGTLVDAAGDGDGDSITFSKLSGPVWLDVGAAGALSGRSSDSDVGANSFQVRVADSMGEFSDATLEITVLNSYSGEMGFSDFAAFAAEWLMSNCVDLPPCGGADLTGDGNVNLKDIRIFADNWLDGM